MATRPAARSSDLTNHGGSLEPTEGVGTVHVNGQPVWVSRRFHTCPSHGAEGAPTGSECVKAGGQRVLRSGDYLLGAGPPNRIDVGSPNVKVGTPHVGIVGSGGAASTFCGRFCALKKDWPNLTPEQREVRYAAMMAMLFAEFGAPPPHISTTAPRGTDATWGKSNWTISLPEGTFESADPPDAKAAVHEARHAEQTFVALRELATPRPGQPAPTAEELAEQGGVPPAAAYSATLKPVDRNSPEGRWARVMASEQYSPEGKKELNRVVDRVYKYMGGAEGNRFFEQAARAYRKRPIGQDAIDAERAIMVNDKPCGC